MVKPLLTVDRLRELLHYSPETGEFHRLARAGKFAAGSFAGTVGTPGYWQIGIDGTHYYAHRLAWLYVKGVWPLGQIDHIDGDRKNNVFSNLRDVDSFGNQQNLRQAKSNSKSGLLGVSAHQGRWRAFIHTRGKTHHLGVFGTPDAAHAAYVSAKRDFHAAGTL